jgi:hypothetical protein
MNKKSESHALYDDAIQTTYTTRNLVGSKGVDGLIDQRANWEGVSIASTRIFHPFEYWAHDSTKVVSSLLDGATDARVVEDRSFKQWTIMPGWLCELAMVVFRQIRGP